MPAGPNCVTLQVNAGLDDWDSPTCEVYRTSRMNAAKVRSPFPMNVTESLDAVPATGAMPVEAAVRAMATLPSWQEAD